MKTPPIVPLKVVAPLKQFGSLWVETIETFDPEAQQPRRYDFVYMRHRPVKGKPELRLAWIRETTDSKG